MLNPRGYTTEVWRTTIDSFFRDPADERVLELCESTGWVIEWPSWDEKFRMYVGGVKRKGETKLGLRAIAFSIAGCTAAMVIYIDARNISE